MIGSMVIIMFMLTTSRHIMVLMFPGIIGAKRNNKKGMDGVADNVRS